MQEQILQTLYSGNIEKGLELAREFVARSAHDPVAQRMLALALRANGDEAGSRAALKRAITLAPEDARMHLELAGLLLDEHDLEGAQRSLDASADADPNSVPAYVMRSHLAIARGDLVEAGRQAVLAERAGPGLPAVLALRGMLRLHEGNLAEAVRLLSDAVRLAPNDAVALHGLGMAYAAQGHLAFAEQTFRKLMGVASNAAAVRLAIAQVQHAQGRSAEAADELAPALADPALATPQMRRFVGELELAAGRHAQAIEHLRQAMAEQSSDRKTVASLAEAWRRSGQLEDARRTLDSALASTPDDDELWRVRLGFEPAGEGAARLVQQWRTRLPESTSAIEAAMVLHASEGRPAEAEAAARELLALAPGHARAEMQIIDALLVRDPAEAAKRLEARISGTSNIGEALSLEAWRDLARHRAGDFSGARKGWSDRHAALARGRLALPAGSAAPPQWPEAVSAPAGSARAIFLVGLPGSAVERAANMLATVFPGFRADRYSPQPPVDAFQDIQAWARIAAADPGTLAEAARTWRAALPGRRVGGDFIDWLPWWDNSYASIMRAGIPEARLVVMLRDPRDMFMDWMAFGSRTPFAVSSPGEAADWLAAALEQLADVHEQELVPHALVRVDDTAEDPRAMAAQLGAALGIELPEPPAGYFGAPRLAPGSWREHAAAFAGPLAALEPVARRFGYPAA